MCGIVGILSLDGRPLPSSAGGHLRQMTRSIAHRGPDDEQIVLDGLAGLGFRRLAIVDMVGGQQPFWNESHDVAVIANGEIYNYSDLRNVLKRRHQFRSESDCEVLVHLYEDKGVRAFDDLAGMYAIAIWDRRQGRLTLARDRLGIKPLFYTKADARLLFASEIKALLAHPDCPRSISWETALSDAWFSGAPLWNTGEPCSYFERIRHLPAGEYVQFDIRNRGVEHRRRYWSLTPAWESPAESESEAAIVERYADLLEDATIRCLQGEAEVGLLLSGGIDSVVLAAIMGRHAEITTFSVCSRSTVISKDSQYAAEAAQCLGIPNYQVIFHPSDLTVSPTEWKRLLWLCETPLCGAEQLYKYELYRAARRVRPGIKSVITGQGSDEFNGGYSTLFVGQATGGWRDFESALCLMEREALRRGCPAAAQQWDDYFDVPVLKRSVLAVMGRQGLANDTWRAYVETKQRDLQMYNCWHEDRTAASHGIEARVPFLDHRLVECAVRIPADLRPVLLWDKEILRRAASRFVPESFCRRPKVPFFYGAGAEFTQRMLLRMLTQGNGVLVEEAFSSGRAADVVDMDAVRRALAEMEVDPAVSGVEMILRLVNLGLLDRLAQDAAPPDVGEYREPLDIVLASELREDWRESALPRPDGLQPRAVLALGPGVSIARVEAGDDANSWVVIVNGGVRDVMGENGDDPGVSVLRSLDGQRCISDICNELGAPELVVLPFLESLQGCGVVTLVQMAVDS